MATVWRDESTLNLTLWSLKFKNDLIVTGLSRLNSQFNSELLKFSRYKSGSKLLLQIFFKLHKRLQTLNCVLKGYTVAFMSFCFTKMTMTCSPVTGRLCHFFDAFTWKVSDLRNAFLVNTDSEESGMNQNHLERESVAFYETSKIGNAFGKKCHKVSGCQPIRMYRRLKSEPWGECCNFITSKLNIGRNLGNKIGLNVSGSLLKSFVKRCQELYLITWIIKICTHFRPIVLIAWARSAMGVKGYELVLTVKKCHIITVFWLTNITFPLVLQWWVYPFAEPPSHLWRC